jgi:hypothetical protein
MKLIEITDPNGKPSHKTDLLKGMKSEEEKYNFIIETLQKDCREVLLVYKDTHRSKRLLWRGEGTNAIMYKNTIWKKRKPLFLNQNIHNASVSAFHKLGLKANRENSIFCAVPSIAGDWGANMFAIFPVDGFSVTWFSKEVPDSQSYIYNYIDTTPFRFAEEFTKDIEDKKKQEIQADKIADEILDSDKPDQEIFNNYVDWLAMHLDKLSPVNDKLKDALMQKQVKEYLITGTSYYGLNLDYYDYDSFYEELFNV